MRQTCDDYELTDAQADRIGKLRIHNDVKVYAKWGTTVCVKIQDHGSHTIDYYQMDGDGRLKMIN